MKRLWWACGIFLSLLALSLWHTAHLAHLTGQLGAALAQAQSQVEAGDWAQAEAVTREAADEWRRQAFYLHTTLRHEDIDEVLACFQETLAYLRGDERQPAEYAAANARLMTCISLLVEAELPSLKNIL